VNLEPFNSCYITKVMAGKETFLVPASASRGWQPLVLRLQDAEEAIVLPVRNPPVQAF
jgi:hypothetical protein